MEAANKHLASSSSSVSLPGSVCVFLLQVPDAVLAIHPPVSSAQLLLLIETASDFSSPSMNHGARIPHGVSDPQSGTAVAAS
jgi:hypothetical protein